jgi:hypothetical protein
LGEFAIADVAERIAQLARQARNLQADGNPKAGVTALQQAEELAHTWRLQLAKEAELRALDDQAKDQAKRNRLAVDAYRSALTARGGASDLEARVKALEDKLDRILKALDGPRGKPGNTTEAVKPEVR